MLSMESSFASHELTRKELEELEREYEILAGQIVNMLDSLSKMGPVSAPLHSSLDEFHSSLNKKLRELDLLPKKPLGASYYRYIDQLVKSLRTGVRETQDFVKSWKGW